MKNLAARTMFITLCLLSTLIGCSKTQQTNTEKPLKIGYISKMLTNQWFSQENQGLADACAEFGFTYVSIDANLDDEACDAAINNLIAQEVDALAICITNQGNGPAVAMKCREAGIALITIDDGFVDENGVPVPHVGMPTIEVGELGGITLAEFANERNFFSPGNVVKVLEVDIPSVSVLAPRLQGYKNSLIKLTPLNESDFIRAETSAGMLEDTIPVAQSTVQAHPEVTHWLVGGTSDDAAIACLKAFEEAGISRDNYLVCGLGGYVMAVEEFEKGNNSFVTVVLDPYAEGYIAVELLRDYLTNGAELPKETFVNGNVATLANWREIVK
jgi:L-arabinose transport system substrate-binding protein